jgi:hypothetical protein
MRLPRFASSKLHWCAIILVGFAAVRSAVATELKLSAEDLRFGNVIVGHTRSLSATLTTAGAEPVKISSISSSAGRVFAVRNVKLPFTLEPGHRLEIVIRFRPIETGEVTGRILFNQTALGVHGWGVKKGGGEGGGSESVLRASPPSLAFGEVQVGEHAKLPIAVTNTGHSSITISDGRMPGDGFTVVRLSSPLTLDAGHSFTFSIEFSPHKSGTVSTGLTLTDRGKTAVAIPLHGTGTAAGQLSDVPAGMNFGSVSVGMSASRSGTLSATEGNVTVRSITSNSSEFVVGGISLPVTIAAGQSVHYTVKFTPQQSGTASAALSFASNASDSQVSESLTGSGVQAKQSVVLNWNASSSKVVGYNVYRGSRSGGPYAKINRSVDSGTRFTDTSVAPGQTYYYVVAAVNTSGKQSKYSNQAQVEIP